MKYRTKHRPRRQSKNLKRRRRAKLMKSACAGLLGLSIGGTAEAFEVNESTSPFVTSGDFDDDFPGEALPQGVTSIVGSVGFPTGPETTDFQDNFQLTGLLAGTQLGVSVTVDAQYNFSMADSAGNPLGGGDPNGGLNDYSAVVPSDGIVVGTVGPGEGGMTNNYTLAISATYVPEPGSGALAALGAAALLGLAPRKREEQASRP